MFNLTLTKRTYLEKLERIRDSRKKTLGEAHDLALLKALPPEHRSRAIDLLDRSTAQLRQDLFALSETQFKQGGFFVEFGATNGRVLSNTFLLETDFGWTGILSEPARVWHDDLRKTRRAAIDTRCVWNRTGDKLTFNETPYAEYSTVDSYSDGDLHSASRTDGTRYDVETVTLNDLLKAHGAPRRIDYLSIDTEGSEYDILKAFDFSQHEIGVMTVEHNEGPTRQKIVDLLAANGFVRKFAEISKFDDWFVRAG